MKSLNPIVDPPNGSVLWVMLLLYTYLLTTSGIRLMGAARRRKRGKRWLVREDRTGWEAREAAAGGKTESHATLSLVSFHLLTPVSSHANSCILLCCLMWISRAPDLLRYSMIILRNMLYFFVLPDTPVSLL